MRALVVLAAALSTAAADPRIIYTKSFPGSVPEFVQVEVDRSGKALYQQAVKDDNPVLFELTEPETARLFELADKLDHFRQELESGAKVARMGMKTFRYVDGAKQSEVRFNHTEQPSARILADWFERIAEGEQHYINLDRAVHFDKLGVNDVLLQLEISYERKRLLAAAQFVPLLEKVSGSEAFMHIARERAARLADLFRRSNGASLKAER